MVTIQEAVTVQEGERTHKKGRELYLSGCRCLARHKKLLANAEFHSAQGTMLRCHGEDLRTRSRNIPDGADVLRKGDHARALGCKAREDAGKLRQEAKEWLDRGRKRKERGAEMMELGNAILKVAYENLAEAEQQPPAQQVSQNLAENARTGIPSLAPLPGADLPAQADVEPDAERQQAPRPAQR